MFYLFNYSNITKLALKNMEAGSKLNPKQKAFCEAYSIKRSGTWAAKEAGYSEVTSRTQAYQLLQRPEIQEYIKFLEEERLAEAHVSKERLLLELQKMAFANYEDFVDYSQDGGMRVKDFSEIGRDKMAAVSEFSETTNKFGSTAKFKLHSKLDAIEKLASMLGHKAAEKKEITVTEGNLQQTNYSLKKRAPLPDQEK